MKYVYVIIAIICTSLKGQSQSKYFEGEIKYNNKYISKMPNVTGEVIGKIMGINQHYLIKKCNYKSVTDGTAITMQLYDCKTNRIYNKTPKSDTLYWINASINTEDVVSFEFVKGKEIVLGIKCDGLTIITKDSKTTFYYSEKYKVDAMLFNNHTYGNWYYFINKSGALPLKTIVENKQFIMESTAVEIKSTNLDNNDFEIPVGTPQKAY